MTTVKGPDFPTGGIICSSPSELREIYETGRGSLRVRARYTVDNDSITITELPYRVSGENLLVQVAAMMNAKKLPMIDDIMDESDEKNPVRLVFQITKSSKVSPENVAEHLLSVTELEKSVSVNMNMIGLDGKARVKGLIATMSEWLEFRLASVKQRLEANSAKLSRQLHLVKAMVIIYPSLDRVIEIIRESENPSEELKHEFSLDDEQVAYILGTRLRSLSRIERMKIEAEKDNLEKEIERLESIINSDRKLRTLVKKEIQKVHDDFGDNRRSSILEVAQAAAISEEALAPSEPVTVSITKKGWVRSAKGHDYDCTKLSFKTGDGLALQVNASLNDRSVIMTSDGRSFTLAVKDLPSARGYGDPVSKFLSPTPGAVPVMMIPEQEVGPILFVSANGYGFIGEKEELSTRNKKGKVIVNTAQSKLCAPMDYSDEYSNLALLTKSGRLIVIPTNEVPELTKGKGVKLQSVSRDDEIISATLLKADQSLLINASTKTDRWTPSRWSEFQSARGRKGKQIPKTFGRAIGVEGE
jgi:topoisomerase-4 subunit A